MAEPLSARINKFYIETNEGIYRDIEVNLLSILEHQLKETNLNTNLLPQVYLDANPQQVFPRELPGLFVWCEGSIPNILPVGQNFSDRNHSVHEEFFVIVKYTNSAIQDLEVHRNIRMVAGLMREILINNLNLNDIMNGPSRIIEEDFPLSVEVIDDRLCPVISYQVKILFARTARKKTSKR